MNEIFFMGLMMHRRNAARKIYFRRIAYFFIRTKHSSYAEPLSNSTTAALELRGEHLLKLRNGGAREPRLHVASNGWP